MLNEFERLTAVHRFMQLNTGINKDLEDIVGLVAQVCEAPVAVISLIDDDLQWFKASVGTGDMICNKREVSFCQYTILQNDLLLIPDTTQDERTANLPIVAGEPHIKFYAGVPLITYDGYAVGTLCILDVESKQLTEKQLSSLKVLGKQVLNLFELNWSLQTLSEQQERTEQQKRAIEDSSLKLKAIFDSSKDIHLLISRYMQVQAFNKAAFNYIQTHYNQLLQVGDYLFNIIGAGIRDRFVHQFNMALNGEPVNFEWLARPGEISACWFDITMIPVLGEDGFAIGVAVNAADITLQKLSEEHINQQNAALQRIAIIQSHELRRPVASLMGLMEVIKLDNFDVQAYYDMLQMTVKELDSKIREIIQESETTISNGFNGN